MERNYAVLFAELCGVRTEGDNTVVIIENQQRTSKEPRKEHMLLYDDMAILMGQRFT